MTCWTFCYGFSQLLDLNQTVQKSRGRVEKGSRGCFQAIGPLQLVSRGHVLLKKKYILRAIT